MIELVDCPLCGSDETGRDIRVGDYGLGECCECGANYAFVREEFEGMVKLQEGYVPSSFLKTEPHPFAQRIIESHNDLQEIEKYVKPGRLFDVCCGSGAFIGSAINRGWDACGNDLSLNCKLLAFHRWGVEMLHSNLEDITFEEGSVDVFTLFNAVEHLYHPQEDIATIRRALKPDGIVYIKTPCFTWEDLEKDAQLPHHVVNYNEDTMGLLLCDFDVVDIEVKDKTMTAIGRY